MKAASGDGASSQVDTGAIDELKRAFKLVEVSRPSISDQLLSRILIHLQHWYKRARAHQLKGERACNSLNSKVKMVLLYLQQLNSAALC